jgi:hypothetical protein
MEEQPDCGSAMPVAFFFLRGDAGHDPLCMYMAFLLDVDGTTSSAGSLSLDGGARQPLTYDGFMLYTALRLQSLRILHLHDIRQPCK